MPELTLGRVLFALLLSGLAGLATTVGSFLGLAVRRPGPRFMTLALGFSAGVMVFVSFAELLANATESLGATWAYMAFFGGFALMFLVDVAVPHSYELDELEIGGISEARLLRTGLFVALGIGIHNFPEGMATFAGALQSTQLGLAIAVAIAIHNIPEGLAVSAPIYAATGSRGKAFLWSFLSGVAEPIGAAVGAAVFLPILSASGATLGVMLASVGGIMVYISVDELLPAAKAYGRDHLAIVGLLAGMLVMGASLLLLS
jgi:ZIP family zinc transporter